MKMFFSKYIFFSFWNSKIKTCCIWFSRWKNSFSGEKKSVKLAFCFTKKVFFPKKRFFLIWFYTWKGKHILTFFFTWKYIFFPPFPPFLLVSTYNTAELFFLLKNKQTKMYSAFHIIFFPVFIFHSVLLE